MAGLEEWDVAEAVLDIRAVIQAEVSGTQAEVSGTPAAEAAIRTAEEAAAGIKRR